MSPQRKRHGKAACLKVGVPKEACYVRFGQRTAVVQRSLPLRWPTVRFDTIVLDFDADGRVLGIELVGPDKPCQREADTHTP